MSSGAAAGDGCGCAAGAEAGSRRSDVIQRGRTCTCLYAGDHSVIFKFHYYYGDSCYYMTVDILILSRFDSFFDPSAGDILDQSGNFTKFPFARDG